MSSKVVPEKDEVKKTEEEEEEEEEEEDSDDDNDDDDDDDDDSDDDEYDSDDDDDDDRSREGRVTPHVKSIVRTANHMESDVHRKSLQKSKERLRLSGLGDKSADEIEEDCRITAQKKIDGATGIQKKLLALEESQRRKAVIEARSLFAEKSVKEKAKEELQSVNEENVKRKADLKVEEDIQDLRDAEKRKQAIEEEKKEMYEAEVFKAKELQGDYHRMRMLANQTHCIPPLTKSEAQWRESTRLQAAEMAGVAAMSEMKRGSKFFDFPRTDDEVATATVAFFSLPNSKASTTGLLPWVKISDEMATLFSSIRIDLFPEVFDTPDDKTAKNRNGGGGDGDNLSLTTSTPASTDGVSTAQPNGSSEAKASKRRRRKKRRDTSKDEKGLSLRSPPDSKTRTSSSSTSTTALLFGLIPTTKKITTKTSTKKKKKKEIDNKNAVSRGEVTVNDLQIEAQRQGATTSMLTTDGISFSRFAALLHKLLRKEVDSPSLLSSVSTHSKVNLIMPRFRDFHPIALCWLPEFRTALKIHSTSVKSYDYLGHCELNPVKAVEHMEQLATDSPEKFGRGALDAVQLDVSRLFKGRLVVAPEFTIACIMGSNESVRNQEAVRAYLKWITNPLLSVDPVIDPNSERRIASAGCVCM